MKRRDLLAAVLLADWEKSVCKVWGGRRQHTTPRHVGLCTERETDGREGNRETQTVERDGQERDRGKERDSRDRLRIRREIVRRRDRD